MSLVLIPFLQVEEARLTFATFASSLSQDTSRHSGAPPPPPGGFIPTCTFAANNLASLSHSSQTLNPHRNKGSNEGVLVAAT